MPLPGAKAPAPMTYLGIDPGSNGGLAILWEEAVLEARKLPVDDAGLWDLLEDIPAGGRRGRCLAVLEEQQPRPTKYFDKKIQQVRSTLLKSTCDLYGNYRMVRALLCAAGIPCQEVLPQQWHKALLIPPRTKKESKVEWKNRLKAKAQQLFPQEKVTLATADALLLMEYGRRLRNS